MPDTLLSRIENLARTAPTLHELSSAALVYIGEAIAADRRSLFVLDEQLMCLRSEIAEGISREIVVPLRIGVVGASILQRQPMRVAKPYEHPYFCPDIDQSLDFKTRSLLVVPLLSADGSRVLGGFEVINKQVGEFSDDDEAALVAAATRVARWIEDGAVYPAGVEAEGIAMRNALGAERASIFALEPRTSRLVALYADGGDGRVLSLNLRLGVAGLVAITGTTVSLHDAWNDARFDRSVDMRTGYRTRSLLCAPTRLGSGRVNGVIQLINGEHGGFTESQRVLLGEVGLRLGHGIARLYGCD